MKGAIVKKGKTYFCVFRVNGKQKWINGGPTKRLAEKRLTEILNDINSGTYKELKETGFGDFSNLWLATYAKAKVKASTLRSYQDIIEKHLIPCFENCKLTALTTDSIQRYVTRKLEEGQKPKTVNNHLVPLKEMLKHAVVWGYLKENPANYVEKPRVEKEEMDFLTPEEIQAFLNQVTPKYYPLFLAAILTGLRRGELLALQWGDVDFRNNTINVRRSLYKGRFVTPKSRNSTRKVIMTPTLASVLKRHKLESKPNELELIFANEAEKPIDPDCLVRRQFLPALRRAGLRKVRFHDLRHSFATLLISQGENVKFVQSQLGHASIQTTLDRYGHLLPESHKEAGKRLDDTLGIGRQLEDSVRKLLEKAL